MKREDAVKLAISSGGVKASHVTVTPSDVILTGDDIVAFASLVEARTKGRVIKKAIEDGFVSAGYAEEFAAAIRALGDE